jgi:hypothetical protein
MRTALVDAHLAKEPYPDAAGPELARIAQLCFVPEGDVDIAGQRGPGAVYVDEAAATKLLEHLLQRRVLLGELGAGVVGGQHGV